MVHHHQDGIIRTKRWKVCDEVHEIKNHGDAWVDIG
jgi:hypothetical protein